MKPKWERKPCGCVKVNFIDGRRAMVPLHKAPWKEVQTHARVLR